MTCIFDTGGLPKDDVLESNGRFAAEVVSIVLNVLAGGVTKLRSFA